MSFKQPILFAVTAVLTACTSSHDANPKVSPRLDLTTAEIASEDSTSVSQDPDALAMLTPESGETEGGETAEGETAEGAPEADFRVSDFEDGFCADDIYARHLKKTYEDGNPLKKKLKRYRSRRSRNQARRQHKLDTIHYARNRMNGPMAPYFGAIPIVINEKVDFWISYYKGSGRRSFIRWLVRGEALKDIVLPVLKEQGIPIEFFYLAMVESGFNNRASSRARAIGTWQFMKGTAKRYGLKINHWVDERRDPVKSTIAAARFLRDLYAQMGDWYLAMASYNAGPGKVRRAIRRVKSRDFWTIAETRYLARETKNYVPKVLAAVLLATHSKAHGFDLKGENVTPFPATTVEVPRPVKLQEVARELGVSMRSLKEWNPEIVRNITPPGGPYQLRVEGSFATAFTAIVPRLTELEISNVHMHKIRSGDTLSHIARRYRVKIRQIREVNPRLSARYLRIGKVIAIPVPGVKEKL